MRFHLFICNLFYQNTMAFTKMEGKTDISRPMKYPRFRFTDSVVLVLCVCKLLSIWNTAQGWEILLVGFSHRGLFHWPPQL